MTMDTKKSFRGRTAKGEPNPIDVHVGRRIKLRRTTLGLSQEKLATLLGLTFQQVQKYERGLNRVGCSRIWDVAKVLDVPVDFFFAEIDEDAASQSPRMMNQNLNPNYSLFNDQYELAKSLENETDPMFRRETIELVRAYYKISNRKTARQLYDLIISISRFNLVDKDD